MQNRYDFDPMKSIHYIQVIDFIKLMKLTILKNNIFSNKLIMTLYSLKKLFLS